MMSMSPLAGRRSFLKLGVLGATGWTLARQLRAQADDAPSRANARSAIFIHLAGGPSHLDTFDLKPDAPDGIRGDFKPIDTVASGVRISEHLPGLAKSADKFSLIRGMSHNLAAHELGQRYVLSGNRPQAGLEYPSLGAVVAKELPVDKDLPPFVAVPRTNAGPGYLGIAYGAFETASVPKPAQPFGVRGLAGSPASATSPRRYQLLRAVDTRFRAIAKEDELLSGLDQFSRKAYDILQSPATRRAFDTSLEARFVVDRFGGTDLGMSCLLAARLVETGVRFVTITHGGWDTHVDNFNRLKGNLLPALDHGVAGLLATLGERGLLESTIVVVTGEFGRTPKINPNAGRDHWPRAMCMLLAGGGIQGGRVVGASDEQGMGPKETDLTPDDVAATVYHLLGIDPTVEYQTPTGRPVMLVREGQPIHALL